MGVSSDVDAIHQLLRHQQTNLPLPTVDWPLQLLSHMHRLRISHTDECPCGTGPQTPEHPPPPSTVQPTPAYEAKHGRRERRCRRSFEAAGAHHLEKTMGFTMATGVLN